MNSARQSTTALFGRVIPAAVGLCSVFVYTRLLDPNSFGTYALLLSSSLLASGIGFAWLRNAVLRLISGEHEDRMKHDVAATIIVSFGLTAVIIGSIEGILLHVYRSGITNLSLALAVGAALASAWNELNASLLQARLNFVSWGGLNFARAVTALCTTLVLIALGWKSDALLGGFILGNCTAFACVALWSPALRGRFDPALFSRLLTFGWPLSIKGGFELVVPVVQRYIIDFSVGTTAVGMYAVANDFTAQTSGSIVGSISLAGIPLAFRAQDRGGSIARDVQLASNARLIFAIAAPLALGIAVLAKPISSVCFGPNFRTGAEPVMALVAFSAVLTYLRSYYFDQAFELALRTRPQAVISAVVSTVAIVSGIVLIPRFAAVGAAAAAVVAAFVGISVSAVWGARFLRVPIPGRSWLKTGIATSVMAAVLIAVPKHGGLVELVTLSLLGVFVYAAFAAALRFDFVRAKLFSRSTTLQQT